jgi:hypothetical protein
VNVEQPIQVGAVQHRLSRALAHDLQAAANVEFPGGDRVSAGGENDGVVLVIGAGGGDCGTQAHMTRSVLARGKIGGGGVLEGIDVVDGGGQAIFKLFQAGAARTGLRPTPFGATREHADPFSGRKRSRSLIGR